MVALTWNVLPAEMKYSVVELLNSKDTTTFSKSNKEAYSLAVPTMFNVSVQGTAGPHHRMWHEL